MAEKRPVENHKEEVPFSHYVDLFRALDPQEAAARTGAAFDGAAFTLRLVDADYRLYWPEYRIEAREGAFALQNLPAQTFLLRYLLEGRAVPARGTFKTFREMPWGELYIQPFTGRCLTRAAFTFGPAFITFRAAKIPRKKEIAVATTPVFNEIKRGLKSKSPKISSHSLMIAPHP